MRAVIYARFSSDRQTEDSISAQFRACEDYAAHKGLEIIDRYADEAISGREEKTDLRREYRRMLKDAEAGRFDIILIHKYDRVARSLREHVRLDERLEQLGVQLIAVAQELGSSKEAKITRSLMWTMSEYYSDNLAEETRKGHRETALKALHNGGYAPFGYDVKEQKYVVNDFEAAYVRKMFNCALNREGFKELIEEMQRAGIKGKRGKPIKYPQVYSILRNEKYTGVYLYSMNEEKERDARHSKPNAIRIEDALPAIIDKKQFEEVQKIMSERKQVGRNITEYLCSGLVYCSCGAKMHGFTSRKKGHEYHYYKCSAVCGVPLVHMEEVDSVALDYAYDMLSDPTQQTVSDVLQIYRSHKSDFERGFYENTRKHIAERETEYDNLMKNLSAGVLPPEILQEIGQRMKDLKEEIAALKEAKPPEDLTVETVRGWMQSLREVPPEKAVHLMIERITVTTENDKTAYNVETTLQAVLENCIAGEGNIDFLKKHLPMLFTFNRSFLRSIVLSLAV